MFGPDPIDIFDPSPYWPLAYYGHYILGTVALVAVFTALGVRKGMGTHRIAGLVFMGAVALLSLTSISMLIDRFIPPLMMAVVTSVCAIGGAYLALQKASIMVRSAEIALSLVLLAGLVAFLSVAVPEVMAGRIPIVAPVIIAIIPAILVTGDAIWLFNPDKRRTRRVARHLSRMVWGFVVVLRAPLVEIAAAGVPIPPAVVIVGPIALGVAMIWYFQRKYGGSPFRRNT